MKFGDALGKSHIEEIKASTDDLLTITVRCPECQQLKTFAASYAGLREWQTGEFIQVALPNLTPEERELLQTGTCETCWNRLYKNL